MKSEEQEEIISGEKSVSVGMEFQEIQHKPKVNLPPPLTKDQRQMTELIRQTQLNIQMLKLQVELYLTINQFDLDFDFKQMMLDEA